jgi:ABC-type glycerol-3-phosphate transport system substrate-binding protein
LFQIKFFQHILLREIKMTRSALLAALLALALVACGQKEEAASVEDAPVVEEVAPVTEDATAVEEAVPAAEEAVVEEAVTEEAADSVSEETTEEAPAEESAE